MDYIFEITTPIGDFYIGRGNFISGGGWGKKYSCWWNGCQVGDLTTSLKRANLSLAARINDELVIKKAHYEDKIKEIDLFLQKGIEIPEEAA